MNPAQRHNHHRTSNTGNTLLQNYGISSIKATFNTGKMILLQFLKQCQEIIDGSWSQMASFDLRTCRDHLNQLPYHHDNDQCLRRWTQILPELQEHHPSPPQLPSWIFRYPDQNSIRISQEMDRSRRKSTVHNVTCYKRFQLIECKKCTIQNLLAL